jgi:type IV pilus assembly protein PilV
MTHLHTRLFDRGFTMLEVLIAIVVLSFGLLGVASLQMLGLKNNQSSLFTSQASALAYDMIDRMRVNRKEVASYDTDDNFWDYGSDCSTEKLSGTEMYKKDINDWLQTLCKRLPSGKGKITTDNSQIEVSIQWDDSRGTGQTSGSTRNLKVQSQYCSTLPCNF